MTRNISKHRLEWVFMFVLVAVTGLALATNAQRGRASDFTIIEEVPGSQAPLHSGALSHADDVTLVAQAPNTVRPRRAGPPSGRPPLPPHAVLTHIPSTAGGDQGIAVRIVAPREARYPDGAPVAIAVARR